ncbi:uncharacterized aarF domain-containing protein kinase 2-like isoform X2 [Homarus americanus]|uniref:uncharacterized aarF domain-containing protein kinase 2-like isoform X2 n=1 Tax=Homarus americanus TaxID=6706 RepID=UPI001C47889A|nr:uncharacterized aarF domain-containing protein kinase 2-like isoform X2 [Homarus americanus]
MSPSMVIHPLLRNTLLAGARKVHIPQVPTTGSNSNSSFVLYGNFIQGCSFSQPSGSKIIPTPLKFFNYHNHQLMHQTNLSSCTPMSKGSVQSLVSHREFSFTICCKIIDSCRNARTRLISKVNNVLQRTPKSKVGFRKVRLDKIILGSMFLSPSQLFRNQKEEKMIIAELPKEPKKKTRGRLFQLLLSVYELLQLCLRALRLVLTFGPILALYPVTYLGKTATDAWWNLLLIVEFSGPILIKLGQWASTRRDIFPDSCCSQFSRLQRRIEPHSWKYTLYQMKKAFGPHWRKVFVKFDNDCKPIGSGCVAQVYKVWMATDAILDNDIMEEILLDMDDDTPNLQEGLEVMGFGNLFSSENLMKLEQARALQDWQEQRELKRHQKKEQQQLLIQQSQAENEGQPPKVQTVEIPKEETDVLSIVENLASDVLNSEDQTAVDSRETAEPGANIKGEVEEDLLTHSLVEEWQEGTDSHDKSLPLDEAPPDDLEGLVPVAIKVLHPGVQSAFKRDLRIMRAFAWFITFVFPSVKWLSLPQCVDEFSEVVTAQINLKTEAENLETFSENFADISFIKFPRPLRPYVTKKQVLVETYEDGEPMINFIKSSEEDSNEELRKRLAVIGVDALLKMVFVDNLVHGDLHPGNMLVQNNSNGQEGGTTSAGDTVRIVMVDVGCDTFVMDVQPDPNPLRICILDCGFVSKLSQQNLNNIRAVFKQIVLGDGESVADLFLNNSEHQCKDPEAFKGEITDLVQTARENTISLGQVDVGMLLQQVLGILLRHHVRLESAFSAVVLAIFVLEGLGRMLDPNMDILERARPILVTGNMN